MREVSATKLINAKIVDVIFYSKGGKTEGYYDNLLGSHTNLEKIIFVRSMRKIYNVHIAYYTAADGTYETYCIHCFEK